VKYLIALLVFCLAAPAMADTKMEVMLQQGISEYETDNYEQAMDHFTAALVYAMASDESPMYPASYLCGAWYFGKGMDKNVSRAEWACRLAQGDKSAFQLELFQGVLESNSAPESTFAFKKAMADAAKALKWYLSKFADQ
jgi:hypothetical protein